MFEKNIYPTNNTAVATYPVVEKVVRFVSSNTRLFFDVIFSLK